MQITITALLCMCIVVDVAGAHLRCLDNTSIPQAEAATGPPSFEKIDEYGDIAFRAEKEHLDHLALQLRNMPDMRGYIIAYAGRRARVGEAQVRAARAKKYLVKTHGVEANRVVTIDGGYREELAVALYLVPRGADEPVPIPTVDPKEVQIIKAGNAKKNRRSRRPHCQQ
jgi:hypothetical protein